MAGLLPARMLLVDDREENLLALEAILGGLGDDLLRATSGSQEKRAVGRFLFSHCRGRRAARAGLRRRTSRAG